MMNIVVFGDRLLNDGVAILITVLLFAVLTFEHRVFGHF